MNEDFDKYIAELYREMELDIIGSMTRNLGLHTAEEAKYGFDYPQWQAIKLKELRRYQRQNGKIIKGITQKIPKAVSKHMQDELRQGRTSEMERFKEAFGDKFKQSVNLKDSFFRINDQKVNALIDAVNDSLRTANSAALRMTNDVYREVIFKTGFFLSNGVKTPQQAIDMATRDFLTRGINCIEYKGGRRVNIADYARMAVRTTSQRAMLIGEGERRQQMGVPFIRISKHGTSCKLCKPFETKVLIDDVYSGGKPEDGNYMLLSKAMELGLFHPSCRHGSATFFPDMEEEFNSLGLDYTTPDNKVNEYSTAHIENMIQRYKRLSLGSADPDNIKKYEEQLNFWEEQKSELEDMNKPVTAFENSKTKEAAEQYAKENFADDVSYKGVSLQNANTINRRLTELEFKYPINRLEEIKSGGHGSMSSNYQRLLINGKKLGKSLDESYKIFLTEQQKKKETISAIKERYKEKAKLPQDIAKQLEQLENSLKFNRYGISDSYEDKVAVTVTHEYAHILADQYFGQLNDERANPNIGLNWSLRAVKKDFEKIYQTAYENGDIYKISEYSSKNSREFFAECFTAREYGEEIPAYIDKFIADVLKSGILK